MPPLMPTPPNYILNKDKNSTSTANDVMNYFI
jgi:hypothetical protein